MPELEDFLPQSPKEGPPLPKGLAISWPWSPFHACMAKCLMGKPFVEGKLVTPQERFSYCAKQCKGLRKP
ncbi:hypothetical protein ES707_01037 [subsurface metagenome]